MRVQMDFSTRYGIGSLELQHCSRVFICAYTAGETLRADSLCIWLTVRSVLLLTFLIVKRQGGVERERARREAFGGQELWWHHGK